MAERPSSTGTAATATLAAGKFVEGVATVQSDGSFKATHITVYDSPPPPPGGDQPIGGQIIEIGADYFVVSWSDPQTGQSGTDRILFDPATVKDEAGNPATLAVGLYITGTAKIDVTGTITALSVTVMGNEPPGGQTIQFLGTVTAVGADYLDLTVQDPQTGEIINFRLKVDQETVLRDQNGNPGAALSLYAVGTQVHGQGEPKGQTEVLADWIQPGSGPAIGDELDFGGQVLSIGADYLEVQVNNPNGDPITMRVRFDGQTIFKDQNGTDIPRPNFTVGEQISGRGKIVSQTEITALIIRQGQGGPSEQVRFGGMITEIGPDYLKLDVRDPQDTTQTRSITVQVVAATQLFDEQGGAINLAGLAVGQQVEGEGKPVREGVIEATAIRKLGGQPPQQPNELNGAVVSVAAGCCR